MIGPLFVMAGPTIGRDDIFDTMGEDGGEVVLLPPASQGDVYAAARFRPWAIGIVDGYFERVPAVWHKEILWAMSQGVRVYGAASMGALRAAELHTFGMRGVGEIFDAFMNGSLEDDDEVTVVHASAADLYRPGSDAMVNLRATVARAVEHGVIGAGVGDILLGGAKAMFYPVRSFASMVDTARGAAGTSGAELDAFTRWLSGGRVDLKRLDAVRMLRRMKEDHAAEGDTPLQVAFRFQHTDAWEQVRRQIDRWRLSVTGAESMQHDAVLEELRLRPALHGALRNEALVRALTLELSARDGDRASDMMIERAVIGVRDRLGLDGPEAVERFLAECGLSPPELVRLMSDEARAGRVREMFDAALDRPLTDVLRLSGAYAELARAALAKHEALTAAGLANPSLAQAGVSEAALLSWWHDDVGTDGRSTDGTADLSIGRSLAVRHGFLDETAMRRALLREWCYRALSPAPAPAPAPDPATGSP